MDCESATGAGVDGRLGVAVETVGGVHEPAASARSTPRTTTEMRISEVEIISMFTPAMLSASNSVAETPECVRMPAPTTDSLPIWSSVHEALEPDLGLLAGERLEGVVASVLGG